MKVIGNVASLALASVLLVGAAGMASAAGDAAKGEKLFRKCRQCHTVEPENVKIGPSLAGVVGRRPGTIEGFGYSDDMIQFGAAGNVWNTDTLDTFLTKPRGLIKKTKMVFPGLRKEEDRADLIAYLSRF